MAHGWDTYIPNLQPPPSNPRPCEVSSGPEGNISSPIENFNAHHGLSKIEKEAVAANSDFNPNSAPTSDCALTCYSDTPWQAEPEPQADHAGSSKCENGDFSHSTKNGFTTSRHFPSPLAAALEEINEDCEILAPSFLENYSDVSSCSEENTNETEIRPSCKNMKSLDQKRANNANLMTTKHSPSEWPFTPADNTSISAGFVTPQVSEPPVISSIPFEQHNGARNMADCAEQKIETKENTSEGFVRSASSSPKNMGTEEDQEDNAGTEQKLKFVEDKTLSIQEKELNIMPGSQEDVAEDITGRYSDELGKQAAYPEVDKCHEKKTLENIPTISFPSVGKEFDVKIHETGTKLSDMNQDNREEFDCKETISSSSLQENGLYETSDAMVSSNIECAGLFDGSVSPSQDPIHEREDNTVTLEAVKIHKAIQGISEILGPTQPSSENCQQDIICSNHVEDDKHHSMDACSNEQLSEVPERESTASLNQPKLPSCADEEKTLPNIVTATNRPEEDAYETIEEVYHEKSSIFEQSDLGMYQGDPSSRENTSCADSEISQCDQQSPPASLEKSNLTDLEVQLPELKSSFQLQKKLQPIIILDTLEPVTGNREYQCTECQFSTQTVDNIIEHYHTHSQHRFKFCPTSNSYFLNGDQQSKSGSGSSNIIPGKVRPKTLKKKTNYKCTLCSHVSHRFYHHVQHTRTHTGRTPFKCKGCNLFFSQSSCLYRHMRTPGRCRGSKPIAAKLLKNKDDQMTKQNLVMEKKVAECKLLPDCYVQLVDICKKNVCPLSCETVTSSKMKNKPVFREHEVKGVGKESENIGAEGVDDYKCPLCPRVFKYSYNRSRHLRGCVKEKINGGKWKIGGRYQCPLCKANFSFANNRARHLQNNCLKNYGQPLEKTTSKVILENEEQPSTPTKPDDMPRFKCRFCPARFYSESGKYKHLRKHKLHKRTIVKYRSFPMRRSKQETLSSKNIVNGTDTSTSKNGYRYGFTCSICGKGFSKALSLRNHKKTHHLNHLINHKPIHQRRIQCTVCKKVLQTIGELIIHRKTHLKRGKLKCPYCPLQFDYPVYLLRHVPSHKHESKMELDRAKINKEEPESSLQSLHKPNVSKCTLCKKVFKDPHSLRKHCLKHITESSTKCPFCDSVFSSRRCMVRHIEKHSGDKPFPCHNCGKRFHRIPNLEQHKKICHVNKLEVNEPVVFKSVGKAIANRRQVDICPYCQRTFCRKNRLKQHIHGHKTNSLLSCSKCNDFYGRTKLTQHEKICNGPNGIHYRAKSLQEKVEEKVGNQPRGTETKTLPHMCHLCPQKFQYPSLLLRHLTRHHKSACVHCGHQFGDRAMHMKHEKSCGVLVGKDDSELNSYNQPRLLRTTSVKEANDKKTESEYKCKFCTKTFLKAVHLRHHILTHTEVKPYRCKACDSCFSRYDHLKLHQTRCKGKRQRLEVCLPKISLDAVGKGWQNQTDGLDISEEQTNECHLCLKTFTSKSNLARHVTMRHRISKSSSIRRKNIESSTGSGWPINGTSPIIPEQYSIKQQSYACVYCPRSFRSSWQLKVHIRLHTGEKPFRCDNCGEKFIRRDYLIRHSFKCNPSKKRTTKLIGKHFPKESLENHQEGCSNSSVSGDLQKSTERPSKGFSCAYCNSTFLIFSQLQQHFLTAHKQDSVKSPASTTSLQQHLSNIGNIKEEHLEATNEEKQINGDGNLLFASSTNVEHAEEKPFPCSFCNMRFKNRSGLGGHLRTHIKSGPYSCTKCMKGFWNKNHQRNHLRKCRGLKKRPRRNVTLMSSEAFSSEIDSAQNDSVLVFKEGTKIPHRGTGVLQTEFSCKDYSGDSLQKDQVQTSPVEKKPVHYQCSECNKSFTDGLMLISHLEEHGRVEQKKNRNTCPECGKVCNNGSNLERHIKSHGIDKTFSCLECSTRFTSLQKLLIHKKHHKKRTTPFVCKICSQTFWTKKSLIGHFSVDHPDKLHSCKLCSRGYTLKRSLMRHYKVRHRISQLDKYSDSSENEESIDHGSVEVSVSGFSDKESKTDEDGEVENDGESSDSDAAPYFPCHVCGKTFTTSENLEDHQRCHLGEKPHECAECGKCFFQASQLHQHQRTHKSEFQCQICHRGFMSLFTLRKHKHSHGRNRPYRCSKCDLSFNRHSHLAEHMAMHREDNFPCDICNCTFSCKSSRAEHRKSHSTASGDLPPLIFEEEEDMDDLQLAPVTSQQKYRCGVCHQCFEDPRELSQHGCLPAKERPFDCSVCDQHFLHESHLEEHKKVNHQQQSYEYHCNQCHILFSSEKGYLNHARRHEREQHNQRAVENELVVEKDVVESGNVHKMVSQVCGIKNTDSVDGQIPLQIGSLIHKCKVCKLTFPTDGQRKKHEHGHSAADTPFKCTGCGQNFLGSDAFRGHNCLPSLSDFPSTPKKKSLSCPTHGEEEEVDVTEDDVFNCFSCPEQFTTKSCLLEHQNERHLKIIRLKCGTCGNEFHRKQDLISHERTHLNEPEAKGTVKTKKRIRSQGSTVVDTEPEKALHVKTQGVKKYLHFRCDMCYRSFRQLSFLKQHLESHVGQVVYECTECDKAFAFPNLLEEHQLTHAGPSK